MRNARIFFLLLPLAVVVARAETDAKASERFSVLGLAFTDEWQYPSSWQSNIRGVSLSLFIEDRRSVRGLAVGLGSDISHDMTGVQFALVGCTNKKLNGIQFAGYLAHNRTFDGLTVAGVFNTNEGDGTSRGVQVAGLLNMDIDGYSFTRRPNQFILGGQIALLGNGAGHIKGAQLALGCNMAYQCSGLQIALVNYAENLRGLQIGALNFADEGSGVQIGFFNWFGQDEDCRILPLVNWRF